MKTKTRPIEDAPQAITESSPESSVYIGCDSIRFRKYNKQTKKYNWFVRYSSVVVLHKDSKHGGTIFSNSVVEPEYSNPDNPTAGLANRLLSEVGHMLQTFEVIKHSLGNRYFELHLDINSDELHASNKVAKQALGWVKGYPVNEETGTVVGNKAKLKPSAWAASFAADRIARYI